MPYKIVDDFNGYDGPTFPSREEADRALAHRREQFYARPGNHQAHFRQVVVDAATTWRWDSTQNRFLWR
jgi:hypothetical protein